MRIGVFRVGLITTISRNIGDDLIREGIRKVLKEVLKKKEIEFSLIDKEWPEKVIIQFGRDLFGLLGEGRNPFKKVIEILLGELWLGRFRKFDLIVNCGAPLLWPGCYQNIWASVLWDKVIKQLYKDIPVLNIAIGSCYPWERKPLAIDDSEEARFLRSIARYSKLITVRDELAQNLYVSLGVSAPFIPCTAFLSAEHRLVREPEDIVIVNYMHGGGHYHWNQEINPSKWFETVRVLIERLKKRHKVLFLCHNRKEHDLACLLDSSIPRIWPRKVNTYFDFLPQAKVALCNRMHASVALASLGIPSVAVGTDTRMLMVKALGLPILYVKETDVDLIEGLLEDGVKHFYQERERLLSLKEKTLNDYINLVNEAVFH